MLGNTNPTLVRKKGWGGLRRRIGAKARVVLPKYRFIALLSIIQVFFAFLFRVSSSLSKGQSYRTFRRELIDFLESKARICRTPLEQFLQQLKGWEDRVPPSVAIRSIEEVIPSMSEDRRVPELYFHLANAYYLSGNYKKYSDSFCQGLRMLADLRKSSPMANIGVKFLFTEDWGWGIGHSSHLDQLVKLRELGLLSSEERIVVLAPEDGANKHYLGYWKKHLRFLYMSAHEARQFAQLMQPFSEKLSGFELRDRFSIFYEAWNLAGDNWTAQNRPPLLDLTPDDSKRGWDVMERWGVPRGSWFVGLHVREYDPYTPNHNSLRAAPNADIQTYMLAIRRIVDRGGWVIRMGDSSMSELPEMKGVIDYANSRQKSDWMDVFLWASCKFFIGTSSGPLTVPPSFGVPVLYTNCCGIGHSPALGPSLMIPKLFNSKKLGRLLTFKEMLSGTCGWTVRIPDDGDLELRDCTPDEIDLATEEILGLLDLGDRAFERRSEHQLVFDKERSAYGRHASTPIANSFLLSHQDLLK